MRHVCEIVQLRHQFTRDCIVLEKVKIGIFAKTTNTQKIYESDLNERSITFGASLSCLLFGTGYQLAFL